MKQDTAPIHDLDHKLKLRLQEYLTRFVNTDRQLLIERCLDQRTRHLTVVLEDVYQPQNANAVLRTCECLGIQDLHVIENRNRYRANPMVVHGADKWITIHRYGGDGDNTRRCLTGLKHRGYWVAAMTLQPGAVALEEVPTDQPLALCVGSELPGLSGDAHQMADVRVAIPMYGFTQSLNLSVSAAIALYQLNQRIRSGQPRWVLSDEEKIDLRIDWLRKSTTAGDDIVKRFFDEQGATTGSG